MTRLQLPIIILIVSIILLCTGLYLENHRTTSVLKKQLAFVGIPSEESVAIDAVQWYKALAEYDPIVALPNVDFDQYRTIIEYVSSQEEIVQQAFASSSSENQLPAGLYPIELLLAVARAEEARQMLLREPTLSTAEIYHTKIHEVLALYEGYLESVAVVVENLVSSDQIFAFWGSATTMSETLDALRALQAQARILVTQEEIRQNCLAQFSPSCPDLREIFLNKAELLDSNLRELDFEIESILNQSDFLDVVIDNAELKQVSPFYKLSSSTCVMANQPQPIYGIFESTFGELTYLSIENVREIYFHQTRDNASVFLNGLAQQGIEYDLQRFNIYLCPQATFSVYSVLNTHRLRDLILATVVSESLTTSIADDNPKLVTSLAKLEVALATDKVIYQEQIKMYLAALQELLQKETQLTPEVRKDMLTILFMSGTYGANLSDLLQWAVRTDTWLPVIYQSIDNPPLHAHYLTSAKLWLFAQPFFTTSRHATFSEFSLADSIVASPAELGLITYTELLERGYTSDKLEEVVNASLNLYRSLR